ncbi:MAG TPA: hypothetical protein EYN28_00445 [Flavobacteriales bacterium]|nr:hypothetical protein [Flavobacteriales bacterium]HIN41600.1 hypothetical protein [Flavobacteriales bacterium]HIO58630.1 hypothetical protein [Flavobacteriales bacterium]
MDSFFIFGYEISGGLQLGSLFIGLISVVANAKLFLKADLPWWAVFVPGYNVMVAMKLIGRPTWHALLFLTPAIIYLLPKTILEVAQSFGKNRPIDYGLVLFFNVFYILNLGLSYEEEYKGPVYGSNVSSSDKEATPPGGMNIAH